MMSACKTGRPKYTARIDNIYFLSRIGLSLRWATRGTARDALPPDIRHLLARLDRQEARDRAKSGRPEKGPPDRGPIKSTRRFPYPHVVDRTAGAPIEIATRRLSGD